MKKAALILAGTTALTVCALAGATWASLKPVERSLHEIASDAQSIRVTDRSGIALGVSYQTRWNSYDTVPLYAMPELLKTAFIVSEDQRFFAHGGVDWQARLSAVQQNLSNLRTVRGASTITEQTVRLINPRKRTLWSRWIEGWEAARLDSHVVKADILEFYLNQVPYAANRRGVVQAARYYFNRDLSTLSPKEMLALAILVRAPSAYDPYRHPGRIETPLKRLADTLKDSGRIDDTTYRLITDASLVTERPVLPVEARHFARSVRLLASSSTYRTTLDAGLQAQVQNLIDTRLSGLKAKNVHNAAVLIADHQSGEIIAWVVGGATDSKTPAGEIDTVTTPRQPGSALKPFLYARALDQGWTAATILDDSPLAEAVGKGLHSFRNYSNINYGPVTLREALGNSLNIPALLTIRHVGAGDYLSTLQKLGFRSLAQNSGIYDEGLALGNGEVTLLEMVGAYAALANGGVYQPLRLLQQQDEARTPVRVYSDETASLIGNILSDPAARRMEFGAGSVLNLPLQTAAKTGTSTDYRDAWTMGYNDRYVVGIWMGNLGNEPMEGVTGSTGPALALRSIFALLNKDRDTRRLYLSPSLVQQDICTRPVKGDDCPLRTEWFAPGTQPETRESTEIAAPLELVRPTDGLQIAYDPRIPRDHQKFRFELRGLGTGDRVTWLLNDHDPAQTTEPRLLWPVERGKHTLAVLIEQADGTTKALNPVTFTVK